MSGLRSVRVRILASILLVTALGMTLAGGAAFLVQRDRALSQIDSKLSETVQGLQSVAEEDSGNGAPATVREFMTAAMQRVLPDTHESIVGIIDGRATMLPSADLDFRLDRDSAFIKRVVDIANPSRVVMGTAASKAGELRYVIIPVRIGDDTSRGCMSPPTAWMRSSLRFATGSPSTSWSLRSRSWRWASWAGSSPDDCCDPSGRCARRLPASPRRISPSASRW